MSRFARSLSIGTLLPIDYWKRKSLTLPTPVGVGSSKTVIRPHSSLFCFAMDDLGKKCLANSSNAIWKVALFSVLLFSARIAVSFDSALPCTSDFRIWNFWPRHFLHSDLQLPYLDPSFRNWMYSIGLPDQKYRTGNLCRSKSLLLGLVSSSTISKSDFFGVFLSSTSFSMF